MSKPTAQGWSPEIRIGITLNDPRLSIASLHGNEAKIHADSGGGTFIFEIEDQEAEYRCVRITKIEFEEWKE